MLSAMRRGAFGLGVLGFLGLMGWLSACSSASGGGGGFGGGANGAGVGGVGTGGTGNSGGVNLGGTGGLNVDSGTGGQFTGDPKTCAEATQAKTYIGCDFWPTPVTNHVWSLFDFAVVVANAGDQPADVTIERGGAPVGSGTVAPNSLEKFYLPWVSDLKGPDFSSCGEWTAGTSSIQAPSGAYHLVSSVPVTVYQFNALEYKGQGGPPGKNWGSCPGSQLCSLYGTTIGCFSFSNDASLLLPTSALTGNYRVTSMRGWNDAGGIPVNTPAYFAVTGTQDNTTVTMKVGPGAQVAAGGGLSAGGPGSVVTFSLNHGDVVEVVGTADTDLSGSLLQATAPVQVISGMPCVYLPFDQGACDHIEESVFPAETWGRHYFVVPPTGPLGDVPGHIVKMFGNVDGTTLQYPSSAPPGAPTTLNAGQVVDLGVVTQAFEVSSPDHEFAVASFQLGASVVDPFTAIPNQKGDPAQSLATAVEQYRDKYVFLAPDDYDVSYVDIVMPDGTQVTLDNQPLSAPIQPLGSGYSIARAKLGPGMNGAHLLKSNNPVGIQVLGYGSYTSYQYPGGLNLTLIAPPPPPIK
jgi:IgGFc binding protein